METHISLRHSPTTVLARRRPQRLRSGQSTPTPPSASPTPQSCPPQPSSSRPSRQAPSASATAATSSRRFSPGSGGWRPSCGRTRPRSSGRRGLAEGEVPGQVKLRAVGWLRNTLDWCVSLRAVHGALGDAWVSPLSMQCFPDCLLAAKLISWYFVTLGAIAAGRCPAARLSSWSSSA